MLQSDLLAQCRTRAGRILTYSRHFNGVSCQACCFIRGNRKTGDIDNVRSYTSLTCHSFQLNEQRTSQKLGEKLDKKREYYKQKTRTSAFKRRKIALKKEKKINQMKNILEKARTIQAIWSLKKTLIRSLFQLQQRKVEVILIIMMMIMIITNRATANYRVMDMHSAYCFNKGDLDLLVYPNQRHDK